MVMERTNRLRILDDQFYYEELKYGIYSHSS